MKKRGTLKQCYSSLGTIPGEGMSEDYQKISLNCGICGRSFETLISPEGKYVNASEVHDVIMCSTCITQAFRGMLGELNSVIPEEHREMYENQCTKPEEQKDINEYVRECRENCRKVTPKLLYDKISQYVIGQEKAKRKLSTAFYNHVKRVNIKSLANKIHLDVSLEKNNILMVGPTGSGKSYMIRIASEILGLPFANINATGLTEAGYIGENIESIIEEIWNCSGKNKELAESGVVFIDEIDKLANGREVGGAGVQRSLLRMLEGEKVTISSRNSRNNFVGGYTLDTSGMLFILGGAFVGMEDIIERKKGKKSIGFTQGTPIDPSAPPTNEIGPQDFTSFGFIPELVGRMGDIIRLHKLSKEHIIKILGEVKDSFLGQKKFMMRYEGIELHISDRAKEKMAEEVISLNMGARGIKSVVNKYLEDLEFSLIGENINKIFIDINNEGNLETMAVKMEENK